MAGVYTLKYAQPFTAATSVTVTHNLNLDYLKFRVIIGEAERNDLVSTFDYNVNNPKNEVTITFATAQTGYVQVFGIDLISPGESGTGQSQTVKSRDLPLQYSFSDNNAPYVETNNASWKIVGSFVFNGTDFVDATNFRVIASGSTEPLNGDIRLFDFTNSIQISIINITTSNIAVRSSTLTNLPATQAIFEVQTRKNSGGRVRAHFAMVE